MQNKMLPDYNNKRLAGELHNIQSQLTHNRVEKNNETQLPSIDNGVQVRLNNG
eukprot:c53350_g1_i1 orf=198-356(+)